MDFKRSIDTTTSGGMLVFHGFGAKARVHIIRERTLAGLAAAWAQGGRPRNLDDKQQRHTVTLHGDPTNSAP